jgi:peptidoglycan hydrolase-like amidase
MRVRRFTALVGVTLAMVVLAEVHVATPANAALQGDVQISGHGYGHGRGLSQWGSRGYAVDHGWSAQQILAHYYGGTTAGQVNNPPIGVELLSRGGRDVIVTAPSLTINGVQVNDAAVLVRRNSSGTFTAYRGAGCGGPWTSWDGALSSGLVVASAASATDPANHVQICEPAQVRGYRGDLQVLDTGTSSAVVNRLLLEDYLRGVLPREMPASWADLGGGRGAQALQSQAVAARSYALSTPRNAYATTCDTTSCQVYGGEYIRPHGASTRTSLEDVRTDAAIAATAGMVRLNSSGGVSRTEFSSSTGGWTAGGTFPAVQDLGDATAGNSHHNWSVAIDVDVLATRLGTPAITGISVVQRNGLGADGGRVLMVAVDTTGGRHDFTGGKFRILAGLRSDWFSVNTESYTHSASYARALYSDMLGRTPNAAETDSWAGRVAGGDDRRAIARGFAESAERMHRLVDEAYAGGLRRSPDSGGYRTWVAYLANGASLNQLNAAIYGSPESMRVLGQGDVGAWVDGTYRGLLGRGAAPEERSFWADVAGSQGAAAVASRISSSAEARQRRLNAYYMHFLQRSVDTSGLESWMPLMQGRGDFVVPAIIASSKEYWLRSPQRFP